MQAPGGALFARSRRQEQFPLDAIGTSGAKPGLGLKARAQTIVAFDSTKG